MTLGRQVGDSSQGHAEATSYLFTASVKVEENLTGRKAGNNSHRRELCSNFTVATLVVIISPLTAEGELKSISWRELMQSEWNDMSLGFPQGSLLILAFLICRTN